MVYSKQPKLGLTQEFVVDSCQVMSIYNAVFHNMISVIGYMAKKRKNSSTFY